MKGLAVLGLALGCAGGALAETRVTSADLAEIRAAIHREMQALQGCGGRELIPSPGAVSFLDLTVMGSEDVVQPVRVTDRAGAVWLAYYALQRQKSGGWRTSGCRVVPSARTVSASYRQR